MRYFVSLLVLLLSGNCQLPEPKETAATIYYDTYQTRCACCGGWRVRVGSTTYRTFDLPKAYIPTDSIKVLVRYKDDDSSCGSVMNDLIVITSIRAM